LSGGFKILDHSIETTSSGGIVSGYLDVSRSSDPYPVRIYFESSYSKQIRTRLALGILVHGKPFFFDSFTSDMRHHSGVREYFIDYTKKVRENLVKCASEAAPVIRDMSGMFFDATQCASLLGDLFYRGIVTGQQLKIIRSRMRRIKMIGGDLRDAMTVILDIGEILEMSHPIRRIDNHYLFYDLLYERYF